MKISKSKQELARIISESGGWQEHCEWAVQDKSGEFGESSVILFDGKDKPIIEAGMSEWMCAQGYESDSTFGKHVCDADKLVKNWHQTILSRAEYFHLYPAPDAKPRFCESVMRSIPEPDEQVWTNPPTIEQLAADYRNAKDYAERKQKEADDAKGDADEKLRVLEIAGEAIGLLVSPITAKQEPELVITVQAGDEVECVESNINRDKYNGMAGTVLEVDDSSTPYLVDFGGAEKIWCHEVKFIRRP